MIELKEEPTVGAGTGCVYCGPICYGGAEHNERVENGDRFDAEKRLPMPYIEHDESTKHFCNCHTRIAELEAQLAGIQRRETVFVDALRNISNLVLPLHRTDCECPHCIARSILAQYDAER